MLHGENHIRDSLGIKGRRLVVNEREGKSILWRAGKTSYENTEIAFFLELRNVQMILYVHFQHRADFLLPL